MVAKIAVLIAHYALIIDSLDTHFPMCTEHEQITATMRMKISVKMTAHKADLFRETVEFHEFVNKYWSLWSNCSSFQFIGIFMEILQERRVFWERRRERVIGKNEKLTSCKIYVKLS